MSGLSAEQARAALFTALTDIAPEVEPTALAADQPIREQVDIDSYDFLQVVVRLHELIGVEIPESDYGRLASVDSAIAYLREKVR